MGAERGVGLGRQHGLLTASSGRKIASCEMVWGVCTFISLSPFFTGPRRAKLALGGLG